ncbi:hypothetical protein, partial [Bacteroides xylanisolvens]|uniref:hypothetical protein n=1 Tax=Bacteroides xylanisolvens TaxID=371601 RepID=UPI0022E03A48
LSSFREHSMRAGKARVWQVHLAVRLCGFPTALFTEYSQMCQLEKDIKNAGSRWTTRKAKECTLLGYSLLGGISLPKSLPVLFPTVYR